MSNRLLTSALLLVTSCQPTPGGDSSSSRAPSMTIGDAVSAGAVAVLAASPPSSLPRASDSVQAQLRGPEPSCTIDEQFATAFGEPTSPEFLALDPRTREAVQRFFLHGPGAVGRQGTIDSSVSPGSQSGGTATLGAAHIVLRGNPIPGYPGLSNITIGNTGSGYLEHFLLQVPDSFPVGPTPLLVVFHKFGVSHGDVVFHTSFIAQARARGWYLLAPLGAMQTNYGSLPSQINTRAALDWMLANVSSIDRDRVYGVGFSMGGGGCASYAARHLNPAKARFAAIVNHTGTVSLAHAHANEFASTQVLIESLFGGGPQAQPFAYQRCSTIDLEPVTNRIGTGTDMARNLGFVHTWIADGDPQYYLPAQTLAFNGHVQSLDPSAVLTVVSDTVHSWSTLDCAAVCTWFATHTLQKPTSADTLADEDGVWHHFIIDQDAPGAFTPFSWKIDALTNELELSATANLRRVTLDAETAGLVYQGALNLDLSSADTTGDQVLFLDVPSAPSTVTRNGVSASGVYNAQASTFLIDETSGVASAWVLVF